MGASASGREFSRGKMKHAARLALESEHFRHSPGEIVLGRRSVDLDGVQSQTRRFLAQDVREHPIAFEQVAQGSFRVTGPRDKSPRGSATTLDHCLTKIRRRQKPDSTGRRAEERLHKLW